MALSEKQIERYARHLLLKEVGGPGQQKLLDSKVLVIGAGGLGSPCLMYLAAAGIGTLGVIDDDAVDLSNLQRQIIHHTDDIERPKVESAAKRINAINPDVTVITHPIRLTEENAHEIIAGYDIVADGSDSFETRAIVNDACFHTKTPLVSAAVGQFDGQLSTYKAYDRTGDQRFPCYRCLFPEPPRPGTVPTCAEAGILGALTGVMGSLQALEVIKELLNIGDSLAGRLLIYDGLSSTTRTVSFPADPECMLCGALSSNSNTR